MNGKDAAARSVVTSIGGYSVDSVLSPQSMTEKTPTAEIMMPTALRWLVRNGRTPSAVRRCKGAPLNQRDEISR